jgi:predicted PurR-regulated permease PerM
VPFGVFLVGAMLTLAFLLAGNWTGAFNWGLATGLVTFIDWKFIRPYLANPLGRRHKAHDGDDAPA